VSFSFLFDQSFAIKLVKLLKHINTNYLLINAYLSTINLLKQNKMYIELILKKKKKKLNSKKLKHR
jgi:hypothetical protein